MPGHDPGAVAATRLLSCGPAAPPSGSPISSCWATATRACSGWATNEREGSFWTAPLAVAAERLAAVMRRQRPDVVVTYDDNGGYGHPDHIQAERATVTAIALLDEPPAKVYESAVPRSVMEDLRERLRVAGLGSGAPDADDAVRGGSPTKRSRPGSAVATRKHDALAAHASQSDGAFFLGIGKEASAPMFRTETFVRVRDTTSAPLPAGDLFAGLR
jgi:LmbE family N-acetylglucosaminyl deacetylase